MEPLSSSSGVPPNTLEGCRVTAWVGGYLGYWLISRESRTELLGELAGWNELVRQGLDQFIVLLIEIHSVCSSGRAQNTALSLLVKHIEDLNV